MAKKNLQPHVRPAAAAVKPSQLHVQHAAVAVECNQPLVHIILDLLNNAPSNQGPAADAVEHDQSDAVEHYQSDAVEHYQSDAVEHDQPLAQCDQPLAHFILDLPNNAPSNQGPAADAVEHDQLLAQCDQPLTRFILDLPNNALNNQGSGRLPTG
ncbi:hypothetical protein BG006_004414, partial [Podila minutissima]